MSDDEPTPSRLERLQERSPGVCILFAHADALGALAVAEDADEHPTALYHLRAAVDALEAAHRALVNPAGTAIVREGEAEPVDTRAPLPTLMRADRLAGSS